MLDALKHALGLSDESRYKTALLKIAGYNVEREHGPLNEWTEAEAFGACQTIAQEALEPGTIARLQAEERARIQRDRDRVRELRRSTGAGKRWFYCASRYPTPRGAWVTVLNETPESHQDGVVLVKVVDQVLWREHAVGSRFTVNAWNLKDTVEECVDPNYALPHEYVRNESLLRICAEGAFTDLQKVPNTPEGREMLAQAIATRLEPYAAYKQEPGVQITAVDGRTRVRALGVEVVV